MDSENNSEEEPVTPLPGRFVWTDEDIEIVEPAPSLRDARSES